MSEFLLYGATGYTGRMIAEAAVAKGLKPTLAGRDEAKVRAVAEPLGLKWTASDLADTGKLDEALRGMTAVMHCAGPFSRTAAPMIDACLRTGTHYLDITGEIDVFEQCAARDAAAKQTGIMLLPGCGFDVVPSDCLAVHLAKRVPNAQSLRLAISFAGTPSRGTMLTGIQQVAKPTRVRRNGQIVELAETPSASVDFGSGAKDTIGVSWGDVATAYYSTGIPNITVEFEATPPFRQFPGMPRPVRNLMGTSIGQGLLRTMIKAMPAGPAGGGKKDTCVLLGEVRDATGKVARSRLSTAGAYWVTVQTAILIIERVLAGNAPVGYQTPAKAYGDRLIIELDGSELVDA